MEISTNIACRVQCDFCPHEMIIEEYSNRTKSDDISYGQPAQMSFDVFKQCIDKLPKKIDIIFSGYSEPFLNPDCSKMIVYAHESGHPVTVDTTLVGMKLDDVDKIKHIPFSNFLIHLPDEPMFAKIAVNENYIKILIKICSNISNATAMCMGQVHPKIKKILKTEIIQRPMISRSGNVKKVEVEVERKLGPLSCGRATGMNWEDKIDANVLLPNGDVAICCHDYGLQNVLGNLIELDYNGLFQTDSYKKIREKMKSNDSDIICRLCTEACSESSIKEKRDSLLKITKGDSSDKKISNSIRELYQTLLYRSPDPEGFNFFYQQIINKQMSVQDVKDQIMKSSEYQLMYAGMYRCKDCGALNSFTSAGMYRCKDCDASNSFTSVPEADECRSKILLIDEFSNN